MIEKRAFTTGSKPGPDEIDHYLETHGYYRKHLARDASSLYRVFGEEMYLIQSYHEKVRSDLATYIREDQDRFEKEVEGDFLDYLKNLQKFRTPGTLFELKILGEYYRRNIILFEPTPTNETTERKFVDDEENRGTIRVFYSQKDKHFDLIYLMDDVQDLAECQAIVYNLLYTDVFRLPDVKYAVERMLHDQDGTLTLPLPDDDSKYKTDKGEIGTFDTADDTECVLKDPSTCHFHNRDNFDQTVEDFKNVHVLINRSDDPGRLKMYKPIDGFLYGKDKSCVRQLLDENITPFPYKVAKALDPSMYRNTEFELWQEMRKESRIKWQEENSKWYDSYSQPIVDDGYVIASEDDDPKKKYVYMKEEESMGKQFSYLTSYNHMRPMPAEHIIMPIYNSNPNHPPYRHNSRPVRQFTNNRNRQVHYGTQQPIHDEYIDSQQDVNFPPPLPQVTYQDVSGYQFVQPSYVDPNSPPPVYNPVQPPVQHQYVQYVPQSPYPQVGYGHPQAYNQQPVPYPNFSVPPPQIFTYPANSAVPQNTSAPKEAANGDTLNLIRESELNASNINWTAKESTDPTGSDLPSSDVATMQFFYNVGVRYFQASGVQRRLESVRTELEALDIQDAAPSQQQNLGDSLKNDQPPPVPTNTPVTTKPPHQFSNNPPGSRSHYSSYHNNRRPFNHQNSRDHGHKEGGYKGRHHNGKSNSHKDIQFNFNPNVRNVQKADTYSNRNDQENQNGNSHRVNATSTTNAKDKNNAQASPLTTQPISPIAPETEQQPAQTQSTLPNLNIPPPNVQMTYATPQPQFYQQYPIQAYLPAQQPYAVNYEGGEQYQTQPYQAVPMNQQYQQVYYAPQTPVYYQQPAQVMDQTSSTNDSGVDTVNGYGQYPPPAYTQIVYPSTPAGFYTYGPPTPQMIQTQPLYQVPPTATNVEIPPSNPITALPTESQPSSGSGSSSPENPTEPTDA